MQAEIKKKENVTFKEWRKAAERLVNTSVEDSKISLSFNTDIEVVREALRLENAGQKRKTLIKAFSSSIRKLEKESEG